ncbi:MAG: ABC transporter transmembrane domain-containing protein [Lachnospiraceae bacterium]
MIKRFLLLSDAAWKNMKKSILASTLAHLSLMMLSMVTALVFWQILQPFLGSRVNWPHIWMLLGVGIVAGVIVYLLHLWQYNLTYISGNQASSEKRLGAAEHMRKLPLSFFEKKNLTELAGGIMNDCAQIEMGFTSLIPNLIGDLFSIVLSCVMLSLFDWRMSLAIFITLPVSFGLILATTKLQRSMAAKHYDTTLQMDAAMQEYLEGIKVTKAFGLTGAGYRDLEQACLEMKRINMRTELMAGSLSSVSTIILRFGTPIAIYVGVSLLTAGSLGLVPMLFFLLVATRIYSNLAAPLSKWGDIVYAGVALGRLRDLFEQPVMEGRRDVNIRDYDIRFEDVAFAYNKGEDVLHDVSFTIAQNAVTAIVDLPAVARVPSPGLLPASGIRIRGEYCWAAYLKQK